jgi:hypothetical protein
MELPKFYYDNMILKIYSSYTLITQDLSSIWKTMR